MIGDEGVHFSDVANYIAVVLIPAIGWVLKLIHDISKNVTTLQAEMKSAKEELEKRRQDCQKLFERKADK